MEDAAGKRAYLEYDAAGDVTGRTDWLGRITRATYDEAGHRLTETTAGGATTKYTYVLPGWSSLTIRPNAATGVPDGYTTQDFTIPTGTCFSRTTTKRRDTAPTTPTTLSTTSSRSGTPTTVRAARRSRTSATSAAIRPR